jgi:hypothetical protein
LDTPQNNRRLERKAHRTKLVLTFENGTRISGYSDNVSLNGLLLTPDAPVDGIETGMSGVIRAEPDLDNLGFSCRVTRVSENGIGLVLTDDAASFGMFVTHDMMLDLLTGINNFFARDI